MKAYRLQWYAFREVNIAPETKQSKETELVEQARCIYMNHTDRML
jgi:hypothetical protein